MLGAGPQAVWWLDEHAFAFVELVDDELLLHRVHLRTAAPAEDRIDRISTLETGETRIAARELVLQQGHDLEIAELWQAGEALHLRLRHAKSGAEYAGIGSATFSREPGR